FPRLEPHGWPEGDAGEERHRQEFAPRQNAVHVVDVNWHQFEVGALLGEVVEPALELPYHLAARASPFGKEDDRVSLANLADHDIDWALMDLDLFAVD